MPTVEHMGKTFPVDEDGFLAAPDLWSPEWIDYVRELEDIDELTEDHMELVERLREYFTDHGIPPKVKILPEVTGFKLKFIYELFPSGPGKGACKMAGLPKPEGCV